MEKLSFEIDSITIKEQVENSQFVRARAKIFASGNNSHNIPVLESALYKAEPTVYQKPLVWRYSKSDDDATGHSLDEVPCGFVPSQGANITYERADDGRLFFCCDVLIWTLYSGKLLEIFEKTDDKKSVSVEILILEKEKDEEDRDCIAEFSYLCITVLGEKYQPAVKDADIILQFSVDKRDVENILNQQSFSNNNQLPVKEVEQVLFNREEFAEKFSMTANEVWELLQNACDEVKYQEEGSEYEYTRYWMRDYDATYIYAYDREENKLCAIPYSISEGVATLDFDNVKNAKQTYIVTDEDPEDMVAFAEKILEKKLAEFSKIQTELTETKEKFSALMEEKVEIETKFSAKEKEFETLKGENIQLLEFKANVEEQEKQDKIAFAIEAVADDLTPEQVDEWKGKFSEFSSVEEFSNALKAFAYEATKGNKKRDGDGIVKMSLPIETLDKNEATSVWQRI